MASEKDPRKFFLRQEYGVPWGEDRCDERGNRQRMRRTPVDTSKFLDDSTSPPFKTLLAFHVENQNIKRLKDCNDDESNCATAVRWESEQAMLNFFACRDRTMSPWLWNKLIEEPHDDFVPLLVETPRRNKKPFYRVGFIPRETMRVTQLQRALNEYTDDDEETDYVKMYEEVILKNPQTYFAEFKNNGDREVEEHGFYFTHPSMYEEESIDSGELASIRDPTEHQMVIRSIDLNPDFPPTPTKSMLNLMFESLEHEWNFKTYTFFTHWWYVYLKTSELPQIPPPPPQEYFQQAYPPSPLQRMQMRLQSIKLFRKAWRKVTEVLRKVWITWIGVTWTGSLRIGTQVVGRFDHLWNTHGEIETPEVAEHVYKWHIKHLQWMAGLDRLITDTMRKVELHDTSGTWVKKKEKELLNPENFEVDWETWLADQQPQTTGSWTLLLSLWNVDAKPAPPSSVMWGARMKCVDTDESPVDREWVASAILKSRAEQHKKQHRHKLVEEHQNAKLEKRLENMIKRISEQNLDVIYLWGVDAKQTAYITEKMDYMFWVKDVVKNGSKQGVVLYKQKSLTQINDYEESETPCFNWMQKAWFFSSPYEREIIGFQPMTLSFRVHELFDARLKKPSDPVEYLLKEENGSNDAMFGGPLWQFHDSNFKISYHNEPKWFYDQQKFDQNVVASKVVPKRRLISNPQTWQTGPRKLFQELEPPPEGGGDRYTDGTTEIVVVRRTDPAEQTQDTMLRSNTTFVLRHMPNRATIFLGPLARRRGTRHGLDEHECAALTSEHKLKAVVRKQDTVTIRDATKKGGVEDPKDLVGWVIETSRKKHESAADRKAEQRRAKEAGEVPMPTLWWYGQVEDDGELDVRRGKSLETALTNLIGARLQQNQELRMYPLTAQLGALSYDDKAYGKPFPDAAEIVFSGGDKSRTLVQRTIEDKLSESQDSAEGRLLVLKTNPVKDFRVNFSDVDYSQRILKQFGGADSPVLCLIHVRVSFGHSFPECQRTVAFTDVREWTKYSTKKLRDIVVDSDKSLLRHELPGNDFKPGKTVRRRIGNYDYEYADGSTERVLPNADQFYAYLDMNGQRVELRKYNSTQTGSQINQPAAYWQGNNIVVSPPLSLPRPQPKAGPPPPPPPPPPPLPVTRLHTIAPVPGLPAQVVTGETLSVGEPQGRPDYHYVFYPDNNKYHHDFLPLLFDESMSMRCSVSPPVCRHRGGMATLDDILSSIKAAVDPAAFTYATQTYTITMNASDHDGMSLQKFNAVMGHPRAAMVDRWAYARPNAAAQEGTTLVVDCSAADAHDDDDDAVTSPPPQQNRNYPASSITAHPVHVGIPVVQGVLLIDK